LLESIHYTWGRFAPGAFFLQVLKKKKKHATTVTLFSSSKFGHPNPTNQNSVHIRPKGERGQFQVHDSYYLLLLLLPPHMHDTPTPNIINTE